MSYWPHNSEKLRQLVAGDLKVLLQHAQGEKVDVRLLTESLYRLESLLPYTEDLVELLYHAPAVISTPGIANFELDYTRAYRNTIANAFAVYFPLTKRKRGKPKLLN